MIDIMRVISVDTLVDIVMKNKTMNFDGAKKTSNLTLFSFSSSAPTSPFVIFCLLALPLRFSPPTLPTLTDSLVSLALGGDDKDIAALHTTVSLHCPLGRTPLILPAKSSSCRHIQCFDLRNYLMMNQVCQSFTLLIIIIIYLYIFLREGGKEVDKMRNTVLYPLLCYFLLFLPSSFFFFF